MAWLVVSLVLTPETPAFTGKQSMEGFDEVYVLRIGPDKTRLRRVRGQAPVLGRSFNTRRPDRTYLG